MAATSIQPHNAAVKFRGQAEREMPPVSQAQNAFMHAHKDEKTKLGKVAREFTKDQKPGSVKKLPRRLHREADRLRKRGAISEKAYAKHIGEG